MISIKNRATVIETVYYMLLLLTRSRQQKQKALLTPYVKTLYKTALSAKILKHTDLVFCIKTMTGSKYIKAWLDRYGYCISFHTVNLIVTNFATDKTQCLNSQVLFLQLYNHCCL